MRAGAASRGAVIRRPPAPSIPRARAPEAEAEGIPVLQLRDEDLEAITELLAEALVAALEHESAEAEAGRR